MRRENRSRRVVFQPRTSFGIQRGAMQIVRAVAPTLGPGARGVVFSPEVGEEEPAFYDNGGDIARRIIEIRGRDEDVGAMLIRELLWRLQNQVGDDTATAAVLFGVVYSEGVKYLTSSRDSALPLQKHLERGMRVMLSELTSLSRPIHGKENLARLAESISYDPEISKYLGEIFDIIGAYGRLEIREGRSTRVEREYVEGMYWERGLVSRNMISDWDRVQTTFENAHILISDLHVERPQDLIPVLEMALKSGVRSLLIIAGRMSDSAINLLLSNNDPDRLRIAAVFTPEYSEELQASALQDIAVLTGGRPFFRAAGDTFEKVSVNDLGQARRVWADLMNFGIVGGKGDPKEIRRHIRNLRRAYIDARDPAEKEYLLERLGKLMGGSATLWVVADTEIKMKRRVEVAERTAAAMRLAMEEGVVPGGGIALLETRAALRQRLEHASSSEERAAYRMLIKAAEEPFRTILVNAGYNPCDVMADLRMAGPGYGFDVRSGKIAKMEDLHVMDPAGVVKSALFGAVKTAALALTVDVIVHHAEPERAEILGPALRKRL